MQLVNGGRYCADVDIVLSTVADVVPGSDAMQQYLHTRRSTAARHRRCHSVMSRWLGQNSAVQEVSSWLFTSHHQQPVICRLTATGTLMASQCMICRLGIPNPLQFSQTLVSGF